MKNARRGRAVTAACVVALSGSLVNPAPPTATAQAAASGAITVTSAYVQSARYAPGTAVGISANLTETSGTASWSGNVTFTVTHLGSLVTTGSVPATLTAGRSSTVTWTFTPPTTDYSGYLVTVTAGTSTAATAIDVSSTWTHYPRFGVLTSFPTSTTPASAQSEVDQLARDYHINALQFYDWMWRHENPVKTNADGSLPPTWTTWHGDVVSTNALKSYISAAHTDTVSAMPYSMTYAGLGGYQQTSGVSPSWGLYNAGSNSQWSFAMTPSASLYFFNPANPSWQSYMAGQDTKTVNALGFDGIHMDQLGNWGNMTDASGNPVDLPSAMASEVGAVKDAVSKTKGPSVGFNAVDGFGGDEVAKSQKTDYLYAELWQKHATYIDAKSYFDKVHQESGGLPNVVAAYMNYYDNSGVAYEAENGSRAGNVSVATDHAGYTGSGFVANFGQPGDSVSFNINAANAGQQSLVFRYSAAVDGTPTRTISVDGKPIGSVSFPATSDWNTWTTADIETGSLTAGNHTISISVSPSDSGYINLDSLTLGQFNPTSVELADSAFAAMGASHIEMAQGNNMLAAPYFPDYAKQMTPDLKAWMKDYYTFITAYEELLYGPSVHSVDSGNQYISLSGVATSGNASPNTVYTDIKQSPTADVINLVNLLGNNDSWRDANKTPPSTLTNVPVKYYVSSNETPTAVHVASPDSAHGASTQLRYAIGSDAAGKFITFTIPSLKNWDMVYVDRGFNTPKDGVYEAEGQVLSNVGTGTDHKGYTGSAFVDNFYKANSGVSFSVSVPAAGTYTLRFRYSNGGTDAARTIATDGVSTPGIKFPSTNSWDNWGTITQSVTLTPGIHTVVVWDPDDSSNAINLDNLIVTLAS